MLLRQLLGAHGERLGVAALAGIKNRERLARLGRGSRLRLTGGARLGRFEAGEEPGKPGALLRCRPDDDTVQDINVFR